MSKQNKRVNAAAASGRPCIDIEGVIGWEVTARGVKRQLARIDEEETDVSEIVVLMNSPGGYIDEGIGIYTALKNHPANIHVHITGMAASMGSVISMAGDKVTMEDVGAFMIHPPSSIVWGIAEDMRKEADVLDTYEARIVKAYNRRADKLNLSADELSEAIAEETWYTSDEALEAGFIDAITDGVDGVEIEEEIDAEEAAASARAWLRAAQYKNTPEDIAKKIRKPKEVKLNNVGVKSLMCAIATDGSAVETTEGNTMSKEGQVSAADSQKAVDDAVAENNAMWTALLGHENAGNTKAVMEIAALNLPAEASAKMMDLVEKPVVAAAAPVEPATPAADPAAPAASAQTSEQLQSAVMALIANNSVNTLTPAAVSEPNNGGAPKEEEDLDAVFARLKAEGSVK